MKTAEERLKDLQEACIKEYLKQSKLSSALFKVGAELQGMPFEDFYDSISDSFGIPKDNTVETNACSRVNEYGEWPDDVYCRDWILSLFSEDCEDWFEKPISVKRIIEELEDGAVFKPTCACCNGPLDNPSIEDENQCVQCASNSLN